jgi:hypothetical protein
VQWKAADSIVNLCKQEMPKLMLIDRKTEETVARDDCRIQSRIVTHGSTIVSVDAS